MGLFRRSTDAAEIERLKHDLLALQAVVERGDPRVADLTARLEALDARITSVATELANQLTELGHELDGLAQRPAADGPGETVVAEIRDGQVRLANEQARYQIAFREDLARLAEELRRRAR